MHQEKKKQIWGESDYVSFQMEHRALLSLNKTLGNTNLEQNSYKSKSKIFNSIK